MGIYSKELSDITKKATEIANKMNSTRVCAPHLIAAAMELKHVNDALDGSGLDVSRIKSAVDRACDGCAKMSQSTIDKYKSTGINRQVHFDIESQRVLAYATQLSENATVWSTGNVEISHLMMALIGFNACPEFNKQLGCDRDNDSIVNSFLNGIVKHEAKEKGITPPVLEAPASSKEERVTPGRSVSRKESKNDFCTDLLELAKNDDKPFVGRDKEIVALMQCLERRDKPNAILAGAPGVGKTDIVRGLAKRIVNDDVPEPLKGVNLLLVDIPGMLAGCEYRGTFEARLKQTIENACKMERPILFIDEIHTVLGAGATSGGSMDAANILKPYLTEGKIRVIGATTADEYRKHVEQDAAFMRRFQKIDVSEPSPKDAVEILNGVKSAYEAFHSVKINKDAIKAAVDLSVRYMHDRFLPDKAIDIMDQTCARVKLECGKKITVSDIESTVSEMCHIPATTVQKDEMSKVRTLDAKLKAQVFGQDEAIDKITEAVQMSKAGLNDETKPIGTFLFVGPSGVGKTEISKQLASNLGIDFVRFDMSEYAEPHTVAKLIGSPAGYVGYDDGGILVEAIRQKPHSVVLFDEIEKAHPDVYKIFLQIFDYGMLTDNKGRKADFRNTIIIMTSNAGNAASEKNGLGFNSMKIENKVASRVDTIMKAVSNLMPPELRGRITSTIVFNPLNKDVSRLIVKKELDKLSIKLKAKGTNATYTEAAIDKLVELGVSSQYGAREIQRVIDNEIKKIFVKQIISGKNKGECVVDVVDNKFVITNDKKLEGPVSVNVKVAKVK